MFYAILFILSMALPLIPVLVYADDTASLDIIGKRTENSKTYNLGKGKYSVDISVSAMHYKDDYSSSSEQWKNIDLTIVNGHIDKAPYILDINDKDKSITIRNKKDGGIVAISITKLPDIKLEEYAITVSPKLNGITLDLPHGADLSISKNKLSTGFNIREQTDADILLPKLQQTGYVDIDSKTDTSFIRKANSTISVDMVDAEDNCGIVNNATVQNSLAVMYLGTSGGIVYDMAVRFRNVTVATNSNIIAAHITLQAWNNLAGDNCNANIYGDDEDNAAIFPADGDVADTIYARPMTAAVAWDAIPHMLDLNFYDTPSLIVPISTITSRLGWASGNPMAFIIRNNASNANALRHIARYGAVGYTPTSLYIEYTEPAATPVADTTTVADSISSLISLVFALGGIVLLFMMLAKEEQGNPMHTMIVILIIGVLAVIGFTVIKSLVGF